MQLKTYKYRLYPTPEQRIHLAQHFGCCRWLYNYALGKKKELWEKDKKSISRFDLQAELPGLKKEEAPKWLGDVNAQSLQSVLLDLDNAYKGFFKQKKGYPKFKKKRNRQSFECPANKREVNWDNSLLTIPLVKNIPIVLSRQFTGKIKKVTITKTTTHRYHACILVETEGFAPVPKVVNPETTIGIDLGLKDFITFDSGEKIENPKYLNRELSRIKVLQRRASKKVKGSNNKKKYNLKISKLHESVTNKRMDFIHKLTYRLTHDNQVETICMEDLKVSNMLKNHNLAQAISDVSWSKFKETLQYKCKWYGKNFIQIGSFEPSSKLCSHCGHKNTNLTLSQRTWQCEGCHSTHDRDINAAINIKSMGLKKHSGEALPVVPVEQPTRVGAMKQEKLVGHGK